MIRIVSNYIAMINKDIDQNISKMFCFEDSIPKASSTSCLNSTWKSNQTDLTLHLSQAYDFQHYTNGCNGHLKWKAVEGKAYELDLADTVYCSCNAATVKPKIHADLPLPEVILNSCGNLKVKFKQSNSSKKEKLTPQKSSSGKSYSKKKKLTPKSQVQANQFF